MEIINRIGDFLAQTGIAQFFNGEWRNLIMILIGLIFLYLAIKKAWNIIFINNKC